MKSSARTIRIFAALSAVLGIIVLASYGAIGNSIDNLLTEERDAQARINGLEKQKRRLEKNIQEIKIDRDEISRKLTDSQLQILSGNKSQYDLVTTIDGQIEYIDWIQKDILESDCDKYLSRKKCGFYSYYHDLLKLRAEVLIDRTVSARDIDFSNLKSQYQNLYDLNEEMKNQSIWIRGNNYYKAFRAFALEGLAYSNLKLGDVEVAREAASKAKELAGGSVTIQMTFIKSMCASKATSNEIIGYIREGLEKVESVANENSILESKYANELSTNYFKEEKELRSYCDYIDFAKIPELS